MTNNLNHNKIDQDQAKAQIYKLKVENKNTCYLVANRNQMSNNNLLNVRDKNHNISATLNCYPADKSFKLKKRKEKKCRATLQHLAAAIGPVPHLDTPDMSVHLFKHKNHLSYVVPFTAAHTEMFFFWGRKFTTQIKGMSPFT